MHTFLIVCKFSLLYILSLVGLHFSTSFFFIVFEFCFWTLKNDYKMLSSLVVVITALLVGTSSADKPEAPSASDDPVAYPAFPSVSVQYGKFGQNHYSDPGFSYPSCVDNIKLNTTSKPNTVASCGDFTTCSVYCFDSDNKYESIYQCNEGVGGNAMIIFGLGGMFMGMLLGGGGMFCYYRKKYGSPYSGYIEINA